MPAYPARGQNPYDVDLKAYIDANSGGGSVVALAASNGTDDTSAINAILAANPGKVVQGKAGENYQISAPLVVKSGTTLDMTGATVTLKAGSNCNMLNNAAVSTTQRTASGSITSGTTTLTFASAVTADVGRGVVVPGAGPGGINLNATITAVSAGVSVTLSVAAQTTVSGATVAIYDRDTNIVIRGGTWARGANGGTLNAAHSIMLRRVDNLLIENVTHTSSGGKYAIGVADVTAYKVRNIYAPGTNSDTVHVNGPAYDGLVENVETTSGGDDIVGVVTTDFTGYNDSSGTVDNLTVRNIAGSTATRCVLLAGSANGTADGYMCQNITVERVRQYGSGSGVYVAAQVAGTALTHDQIVIRGVEGGVVNLRAPHMGQVTVENVTNTTASAAAVVLSPEAAPQNNHIIDRLTMRGCKATTSDVLDALNSTTVIGQADLYDCSCSAASLASLACSTVTSLRFHNCEHTGTGDAVIVGAAGTTITEMVFNSLRATNPTTTKHVVKVNAGTVQTVEFNNPQVTAVDNLSGSLVFVNATSVVVGKVNVKGGKLDGIRNVLDHQGTGTAVVTHLTVDGTHFNACNRIFQASNVTLNFAYSNVTNTAAVNQPCRIFGGGALNVRGYGWQGYTTSAAVRATTEVVHVVAQDFPVDVSILTGANGDTHTNTNTAANPFVAGPLIRDATNAFWTHEQGYALAGTATLAAGTVTVSNTNVTANAVIRVVIQTPGGTVGAPFVSTITAATSFVIKSTSATDTSVVRWEIVRY